MRILRRIAPVALFLFPLGVPPYDIPREYVPREGVLIIAHRRNSVSGIEDAIRKCADGIEVDVRFDRRDKGKRELVLAHDPVTAGDRGLLRLTELYDRVGELSERYRRVIIVYLHFRKEEDAVAEVAEQVNQRGVFRRFIFFGEDDATIQAIVRAKKRFPRLLTKVNPRYVEMQEIEEWFRGTPGGVPDFVQFDLWTPVATRARLAATTNLAFDTMLNSDLVPLFPEMAKSLVGPALRAAALIQTDYPERFRSSCPLF